MTIEREVSGPTIADMSNEIVSLFREHFGRGPTQARTIWNDDVVVAVLRGGYTPAEKTLYAAGKDDAVEHGRRAMQDVMEREMKAIVERRTNRRVVAFLSANHHEPDVSVEVFVLAPEPGRADGPAEAPDPD